VCREFFAATITLLLLLLLESSKSLRPLLLHAWSFLSLFARSWSSLNFLPLLLHAFPFLVTFGMQRCSWSSLNLLPLLLHACPSLSPSVCGDAIFSKIHQTFQLPWRCSKQSTPVQIPWPHFTIARFHIAGLLQT
jgi:hypothetical protein